MVTAWNQKRVVESLETFGNKACELHTPTCNERVGMDGIDECIQRKVDAHVIPVVQVGMHEVKRNNILGQQ
jgi:hypothetical protein